MISQESMGIPKSEPPSSSCFLPQDSDLDGDYESEDTSDDDDPTVFKLKTIIKPPEHRSYTTAELHELIHQGSIDLNPSYQRDVVWADSKQIALIESIMSGFHVPTLVFVRKMVEGETEEQLVCVDGKQRFLDGLIPCKDKYSKSWHYTSPSNNSRSILPDKNKEDFRNKSIKCEVFNVLSDESEREMFRRVQLGMALTSPEKWRGISSPWATWLNDLQNRYIISDDGLAQHLDWILKRGSEFTLILNLVYFCDGIYEKRIYSHSKVESWLKREDPPTESFKQKIGTVLRDFWLIITSRELKNYVTDGKKLSPVEFGFIGVLLFLINEETLEVKANAIQTLRTTIHTEYAGHVRNNNAVGRTLWTYIDVLKDNPLIKNLASRAAAGTSRKRKVQDDQSDGEYHPNPVRGLGKATKTRARASRS